MLQREGLDRQQGPCLRQQLLRQLLGALLLAACSGCLLLGLEREGGWGSVGASLCKAAACSSRNPFIIPTRNPSWHASSSKDCIWLQCVSKVAGATPTFPEQFLEERWLLGLLQPAILVLSSCCSLPDIILVLMLREVAPVRCCWVLIAVGAVALLLLISTHPLLLGTQSGEEWFDWRHSSRQEGQ